MIITKAVLAQQVIRRVSGGDQSVDSSLDRREVMKFLTELLNRKVKEDYFENYKLGEPGVDGQYIGRFPNNAVVKDNSTQEYYTVLPSCYVALPKSRGIRQVSSMTNQKDVYIIRENGNKGIFAKLQAGKLQGGRIGCYAEGNRLWFDEDMGKKNVTQVLIKLVVAGPDTIGEDDPLPIDAAVAADIVKEVFLFFSQMVPQDKVNNNNPNS